MAWDVVEETPLPQPAAGPAAKAGPWDVVDEAPVGVSDAFRGFANAPASDAQPSAMPADMLRGFQPEARGAVPGSWERLKVNAADAFDNTVAGEIRNRVNSGQVALDTANDMRRAITDAYRKNSPVGLENFSDGTVSPYAGWSIDDLWKEVIRSEGAAAEKRPVYDEAAGRLKRRIENVPSFTDAPSVMDAFTQGLTSLVGQLGGGLASPENFVGGRVVRPVVAAGERALPFLARTVAGAGLENATINAATNPMTQMGQVSRGERPEFDTAEFGGSVLLGGAIGALMRAPAGLRALREWKAGKAGVHPDTIAPETLTPDDAKLALEDPQFKALMEANNFQMIGPTLSGEPMVDPRVDILKERLARRRVEEQLRPVPDNIPLTDAELRGMSKEGKAQPTARQQQIDAAGPNLSEPAYGAEIPPKAVGGEPVGPPQQRRAFTSPTVDEGQIHPAAANVVPRADDARPIAVDKQGGAYRVDDGAVAGREAAPGLQRDRTPLLPAPGRHTLTDAEIARQRADIEGGQHPDVQTPDKLYGGDERLPQTRDQNLEQRLSDQAFELSRLQRERALSGDSVRDTQVAGRPQGRGDITVHLDDGRPVEVLSQRMENRGGREVEIATVREYDPRTGKPTEGAVEYNTPYRQLKTSQYAPQPRMAQDFEVRAEVGRVNAGKARGQRIDESQSLPRQTYRETTPQGGLPTGPAPLPRRVPDVAARPNAPPPPPPRIEAPRAPAFRDQVDAEQSRVKADYGNRAGGAKQNSSHQAEAAQRVYDREGRPFVDAIVNEVDAPAPDHGFIAQHYQRFRNAGDDPETAASKAFDEFYAREEATALRTARDDPENDIPVGPRDPVVDDYATRIVDGKIERPFIDAERARDNAGLDEAFDARPREGGQERQAGGKDGADGGANGRPGDTATGREPAGGREVRPFSEEPGADGKPQTVIPGAERREPPAAAKADDRLKGGDEAPPKGGLFDEDSRNQQDLFDKKSSDGFTLSANPFLDPKNWGRIKSMLGWTDEYVRDIKETWRNFQEMRANAKVGAKQTRALGDIARWAFYSTDGELRALAHHYDSPTIKRIADMLFAPADAGRGGAVARTYHEAADMRTISNLNRLGDVMKPFIGKADQLEQIRRLVQNPQNIRDSAGGTHTAARALRKLLDDEFKYLKEAGVDVGEIKGAGYFPRIIDHAIVMRDQAGFVAAAAKQYLKDGLASTRKQADEMAQAWLASIELGHARAKKDGTDFVVLGGTPNSDFRKERVFSQSIEKDPNNPLRRFYIQNPVDALTMHFQRTARRAEWARRFGDDLGKWKDLKQSIMDEGNVASLRQVVDIIGSVTGVTQANIPDAIRVGANIVRTWGAIRLLPRATVTSLSEIAMPAIRAGNLTRVLGDVVRTTSELMGGMKAEREIAEDIGIITKAIGDSTLARRYNVVDQASKMQQDVVNRYFRRTGLEQLTNATRVVAVSAGQTFIRRLALDVTKETGRANSSRAYLRELGVENVDQFARWVAGQENQKPTAATLRGDTGMEGAYNTALLRFTNQSIMAPSTSTRPRWANHPLGSLVFMLQSYAYAFTKNVLGRAVDQTKEAVAGKGYTVADRATMLAPAMMLPLLTAIQYGIGPVRDAVWGDPNAKDPDKPDPVLNPFFKKHFGTEAPSQAFMKALSRSGLTGVLDPYINMVTGSRYERDAATAIAGPTLGGAFSAADTSMKMLTRNSDRTNTAERNLARNAYDLLIAPAASLAASFAPVPFGAAAIQSATSGDAREAFVGAVAGGKSSGRHGSGLPREPKLPKEPRQPR